MAVVSTLRFLQFIFHEMSAEHILSGPMPVLEPKMGSHGHDALNESLRTRVRKILRLGTSQAPRAIVVITPHWRPDYPTVTMVDKPQICHDFEPSHPPAAWEIQYEAPGSSEVANLVHDALSAADLKPAKDFERGMYCRFLNFEYTNSLLLIDPTHS